MVGVVTQMDPLLSWCHDYLQRVLSSLPTLQLQGTTLAVTSLQLLKSLSVVAPKDSFFHEKHNFVLVCRYYIYY